MEKQEINHSWEENPSFPEDLTEPINPKEDAKEGADTSNNNEREKQQDDVRSTKETRSRTDRALELYKSTNSQYVKRFLHPNSLNTK